MVAVACRHRAFNPSTQNSASQETAPSASDALTQETAVKAADACGGVGSELVLCGGVPHLFVACDDSALPAGQTGCTPPGEKRGRFYFYVMENGQPRTSEPIFTNVVRMREDLLGVNSGREATRTCGEAFDAIYGSRSAYTLKLGAGQESMADVSSSSPIDLHAVQCRVEINTRLGGQATVSVIPLLPQWKVPSAFKRPDFRGLPMNPAVGRNPWKTWYGIPASAPAIAGITPQKGELLYAMLDMHTALAPFDKQVESCLKNSRARGNLDLQHHYYCQLPKDPYRACLGGRIAAYRLEPACAGKMPNVDEAISFCFERSQLVKEDGAPATFFSEPDKQWRVKAFRDAFLVVNAVKDFDIEQQNEVIDAFYKALGKERIRRVIDTWPTWTPDQPRYLAQWEQQSWMRRRLPPRLNVCETPPKGSAPSED